MMITLANPSRSDGPCRTAALALVFGLLAMLGPAPAFALPLDAPADASGCCDSCEAGSPDQVATSDVSFMVRVVSRAGQSEDGAPNNEPCCPDGCTHCSLPCCGQVLSAHDPLTLTAGFPHAGFLAMSQDNAPLSVDPLDVTHPPRP
jgi:hypothetical protein